MDWKDLEQIGARFISYLEKIYREPRFLYVALETEDDAEHILRDAWGISELGAVGDEAVRVLMLWKEDMGMQFKRQIHLRCVDSFSLLQFNFMTVSEQELAKMIAVISMLLAFMKSDSEATDELVGNIESIAALTKAVLELTGQPPFLLSFSFLWKATTEALVEIEKEFFPDLPQETPTHLVTPNHFLPLSQVTLTSWSENHKLIEPAFLAIQKFRKWFKDHYSIEIHDDVMSLCEDALLLTETLADMCNVVLHNT